MNFPRAESNLPFLTTQQMIEVDRAMVEDYKIELIQMMENAGRNLANLARKRFLQGDPRGKSVIVMAGNGGNGGGALVAARHLQNYGAEIAVLLSKPDRVFANVPLHQLTIIQRMNIKLFQARDLSKIQIDPELIIDGIIGYSLKGAPRNEAAKLIEWANSTGVPILALDIPSGMDGSTGHIFQPTIRATATLTLALPKEGFRARGINEFVGELYLGNIGVPPSLYLRRPLNLNVGNLFYKSDIIKIE